MIVDDEEPVLESYAFMIEHDAPQLTLCAQARSGFEAISLAHQTRPDIVVMDIGIPGIDGLDTIKELQQVYPETVFILSTAYERFDLAQRAIPLGVSDYLVKPISRKTFLDTLGRARSLVDERRKRTAGRIAGAERVGEALVVEERNLLHLLTWKSLDEAEWTHYRSLFSLSSDFAYLMLVQSDAPQNEGRYAEIVRQLSRRYQCLSAAYAQMLIVLVSDVAGADNAAEKLREITAATASPGEQWATANGGRRRYDELYRSFEEALGALPDPHQPDGETWEQRVRPLRNAIARAVSFEEVHPQFCRYWDEMLSRDPLTVAKGRMVALFTLLQTDLGERLGDPASARLPGDPVREIMQQDQREGVLGWAGRALRTLVEREVRERTHHWPAPLTRAVRCIDEQYAQPLQLSQLAEQCGVSAGYLSRLFSENLATTFVDYLNSVRLHAAEELLSENRLSVKEIAYAVGYQDPNYFSRIFKKHRGVTPTSFPTRRSEHEPSPSQ